jgi:aminoglycoside phosphotransferase (APT) family kinase protein
MPESSPSIERVHDFLERVHGPVVRDVQPLAGGYWSAAYAYRLEDRELVLRLGTVREGFEMDREAMAFDRPDLPVPEVLDIGDAFGAAYAISVRHHGRFLETARPDEAAVAGTALDRTLRALRAAPATPTASARWYPSDAAPLTWHGWLRAGLVDDPAQRVSGWRAVLAADAALDRLFRACEARIDELADACPERRDLVHGDLLNRNVLIADDASRITAVYSWKCSVRGDFLFDVAWCTFWSPWHPGIAALDLWDRTMRSPSLSSSDVEDAAARHHCYELQIGANHLGWNAWTGNHAELHAVATHTAAVLERGPLLASTRPVSGPE